jgi:superfamily I DNA and RNA helicase
LAKIGTNEKNIIWAYDELQNILDIQIRSAESLFGADRNGQPKLSLERAAARLYQGQINDSVLTKCYRNQSLKVPDLPYVFRGLFSQVGLT